MLVRRKVWFVAPFAAVLAISAALAFLLPATYRSEATILIQRQSIPKNLVDTTITTYVEEQIQETRNGLRRTRTCLAIAEKFDLYPRRASIEPVGRCGESREEHRGRDGRCEGVVARSGRRARCDDRLHGRIQCVHSRDRAGGGTDALAKRYLDEHRRDAKKQAADVSAFLQDEADKLKDEIATLEKAQAQFKQREQNQLPELRDMNLSLFERTQQEIETSKTTIRALQAKIDAAKSELSLTQPYKEVVTEDGKRMLSASERLSVLTADYLRACARYSPEHPDVLRLSREIRVLAQANRLWRARQ